MPIRNAFEKLHSIEVGYNEDTGYFLNFIPRDPARMTTHLTTCTAITTAMLLLANEVVHFDYHQGLANNPDATSTFIREAATVGLCA